MLTEALQFLKDNFPATIKEVGGKTFSDSDFTEIKPEPDPLHGQFEVTTLGALRDLINSNVEKLADSSLPLIHIVSHQEIRMLTGISDEHGRRRTFARATPAAYQGFKFDTFHSLEQFRIGIQAHFSPTPDRDYVLSVASKVTDGEVTVSEDDGVSQQVELKAGLSLKATEVLKSRVTLAPFRTFPEADQPQSEFIFRARKTNDGPGLALFEADGGKWKVAAVQNIAFALRNMEIKLPIIS